MSEINTTTENMPATPAETSAPTGRGKYIFRGILLGIWLIILLSQFGSRSSTISKYNDAIHLMENGNYKEAVIAFKEMEGYGSSEYYLETIYAQHPQYKFVNTEIGELVTFGMYAQSQSIAPIEWYVIAQEDNRVLLMSKHVIDAQPFSGTVELPAWLEEVFRKDAFSDVENAAVSTVSLLTREQVDTYVTGKPFASCAPTSFAISRGYRTNYAGNYMWWIDEASFGGSHFVASPYGSVGRDVHDDADICGVRPAIWVTLE